MNIGKLTFETHKNEFQIKGWEKVAGIIPESYKQRYLALYEKSKDNKIENKTTVYSTPLSELPPYKLKNYIEENKLDIKTARKLDKLDAIIISDNFIRDNYLDLKEYKWDNKKGSYFISKSPDIIYLIPAGFITNNSKFLKYRNQTTQYGQSKDILVNRKKEPFTHYVILDKDLNNWIKIDPNFEIIKQYSPILGHIITNHHGNTKVCKNIDFFLNNWIKIDPNFEIIKQHSPILGHVITNHHGNTKACKNIDFFLNLIDNVEKHNLKIILDISVNNEINQGVVIDFDMYQTLYNMLNSADAENWNMAREITANCEYETSKPYLMHLYCSFSQLRKANGSANYQFLKKKLDKDVKLSNYGRTGGPSFTSITKHLVTQHPTYNQIFLDCFKYQVNTFIGKDIIKEITSY